MQESSGIAAGTASFRPYYENPYSEHYVGVASSVRRHSLRPTPDAPSNAPLPSASRLQRLLAFLNRLPVVIFYKYLWHNDRKLFLRGVFVNYLLPMLLELLPLWWLSSRKMHIELRAIKLKIQNTMQTAKQMDSGMLSSFFWVTVWHCVLDCLLQQMALKVSRENGLVIKKLVMERLLYAELGYIEEIRTLDLETQISNDVNQTLSFFNYTLPALIGSVYSLAREGTDLFNRRDTVDYLFYVQPVALGLVKKAINWVKFWVYDKPLADRWSSDSMRMGQFVTNALAGLSEIQINNLQQSQLIRLDHLIRAELKAEDSMGTLSARLWNHLSGRSLLEFVSEVWTAHQVMSRRGLNHEQFRRLQYDVDRLLELAQRTYTLIRVSRNVIDYQMQVVDLFAIPNWLDENDLIGSVNLLPFSQLQVKGPLIFAYPGAKDIALRLSSEQEIVFRAGKQYAVVGQNRSGKSTLANLLCKLYKPSFGQISINGVPYAKLRRTEIRSLITYVSQKPYLFPGTIRDNIRIGNESATDEDIRRAAMAAGVFAFGTVERPKAVLAHRLNLSTSTEASVAADASDAKEPALPPMDGVGGSPAAPRRASVSEEAGNATTTTTTASGEQRDGEEAEDEPVDPTIELLDMELAARGANVSGGFAQSIALARIFVRPEARVIILDEAMGQMDAYKKREIIAPRLREHVKRHNITLITISHDLGSVQDADCIYVLHRGTLAHAGSHADLVQQKASVYMRLLGTPEELRSEGDDEDDDGSSD